MAAVWRSTFSVAGGLQQCWRASGDGEADSVRKLELSEVLLLLIIEG